MSTQSLQFTILSNIHSYTHSLQPRRVTVSSSGAVRVRRPAQGHLDIAGIDLATLWLTANPLYLLNHMMPQVVLGVQKASRTDRQTDSKPARQTDRQTDRHAATL